MNQPPRSIYEHIKYFQLKGMIFPYKEAVTDLFSRVGYSRIKYIWRDLIDEDSDGDFVNDAIFTIIIERYAFGHNLRLILFDAIEPIEVELRAKIIDHMSKFVGNGFWYFSLTLFGDERRYKGGKPSLA